MLTDAREGGVMEFKFEFFSPSKERRTGNGKKQPAGVRLDPVRGQLWLNSKATESLPVGTTRVLLAWDKRLKVVAFYPLKEGTDGQKEACTLNKPKNVKTQTSFVCARGFFRQNLSGLKKPCGYLLHYGVDNEGTEFWYVIVE